MITRSKAGIFKPKVYIAALIHKEPNTIQEALSDSRWLQAMKEDNNALPKQDGQQVVGNK